MIVNRLEMQDMILQQLHWAVVGQWAAVHFGGNVIYDQQKGSNCDVEAANDEGVCDEFKSGTYGKEDGNGEHSNDNNAINDEGVYNVFKGDADDKHGGSCEYMNDNSCINDQGVYSNVKSSAYGKYGANGDYMNDTGGISDEGVYSEHKSGISGDSRSLPSSAWESIHLPFLSRKHAECDAGTSDSEDGTSEVNDRARLGQVPERNGEQCCHCFHWYADKYTLLLHECLCHGLSVGHPLLGYAFKDVSEVETELQKRDEKVRELRGAPPEQDDEMIPEFTGLQMESIIDHVIDGLLHSPHANKIPGDFFNPTAD